MYTLDSKKIDGVIKQLENAGKGAVRVLNEMTDGSLKDSPLEKDPFTNLGYIVNTLVQARDLATLNAKYDGMTPEQIDEAQAAERIAEAEALQQLVQEKLAARQPVEPEPTEETEGEPTGDEATQV
ncbi:hypothetical protein [Spirosoma agri]|uniref:Uncharacterized protein n=1 Tax=Spirosoma agri TaxID=1987381 RepID=A0A6M0IGT7_9BACT|nr:hypothetical protein [Spirosoma agri]NEU67087.1 hypothetical protein [Spirosoma agri]